MKTLSTKQVTQVSGGATTTTTPVTGDLGFFPRTGIAFIDQIHVWEYANIWGPLLAKIKAGKTTTA